MAIPYIRPTRWIQFDTSSSVLHARLSAARAAILALTKIPYQRSWADPLQQVQLKREVAGTSRIEGAEFTDRELDQAMHDTPGELETRSQRQAAAAVAAYRWIAKLPSDRPIDRALILEVHRLLVKGCDDDHCEPGTLRASGHNVTFGTPRHRGCEGGEECERAFSDLAVELSREFQPYDSLIQAFALHYHIAAMHPFGDGNGRTARALEALILQRTGLRDTLFIAMSNYYYENKAEYLQALNETRAANHDLTPFLLFALPGIERQCNRLFEEIRFQLSKALFRNTVTDLFGRLQSPKRRVMSARHVQLLNFLLDDGETDLRTLTTRKLHMYSLKNPTRALIRDLNYLIQKGAIKARLDTQGETKRYLLSANLDWPAQITETEFFKRAKELPKGKQFGFLSS